MFIFHFITANIIISVLGILIYVLKLIFADNLSPKVQYYSWIPFILIMFCVFIPELNLFANRFSVYNSINSTDTISNVVSSYEKASDIYLVYSNNVDNILLIIWAAGIVLGTILYISAYIRIIHIINKSDYIDNYNGCKLYITNNNISPFSFGILKKSIVLPSYITINSSSKDIEYIIKHELTHYRHKDNITNFVLCVLNILFWFNPLVYIIFDKIRLDMEIYCDFTVINYENFFGMEYGNTLINFAEKRKRVFNLSNNIAGTENQLKIRLRKIISNNKHYNKNIIAIFLLCIILSTTVCFSLINVFGYSIGSTNLNDKNKEYVFLEDYFKGYNGCFVLYNENTDKYTIYNEKLAEKRYSPYSTYKIAIALNGLENNIITENNSFMKWNGENYPFSQWNNNQNLNTAFKNSVNWYFQNIDSNISYTGKKIFLNNINYGNKNIGFSKDNYWLDGSLKISSIEQVEFLKNVFKDNKYSFKHTDTVKNKIKITDSLYGKTGSGHNSGWFIGIIENNDNCYFALHITGDGADGAEAYSITEKILNNLNLGLDN